MRERRSANALAAKLFCAGWIAVGMVAFAACDDGLEPIPHAKDAGTRPTTSAATTANKDGGAGDAALRTSPEGGAAAAATGQAGPGMTADGGGTTDAASGASTAPAGPVVAACVSHGGESVCDGAVMIRCGMAGNSESSTPCSSEARCRAGLTTGKCGTCDPGSAECVGAELQECGPTGEITKKTPCASEALCSRTNKSCDPSKCGEGAFHCEGALLQKCKADLSGWDQGTPCMSKELCSEPDKRCNDCAPNSKVCNGDTLMVCSADGKGPMAMPCSGTTSKCNAGKCVQCKEDSDCMTTADCRVATCNKGTGMCVTANAPARVTKCMGGNNVCDVFGGCVQCIDDGNCPASKFCLLGACADRRPLTLSLFGCSFELNAGYKLEVTGFTPTVASAFAVSGRELILTSFTVAGDGPVLRELSTQAHTYSLSDSKGATCSASTVSTSSALFVFTSTTTPAETLSFTLNATTK